jgi:outer membrane protein assembly factor BamD
MPRTSRRLAAALALTATAACHPDFQLKNYTGSEALYTASLHEYQKHHWDNAILGFEKLTTDLSPRDTLLPRAYWYLASSHDRQSEHLLAAQSYERLVETFPEDSLADDAALAAAKSYRKLWRKPQLDDQYGLTALASYNTLIGLYPTSPLIPQAQKDIAELEEWFAKKDYDAGDYYFRIRKCYDCAMIYFNSVLAKYPNTTTARQAAIRLVQSYRAINYKDDASEMCTQLRQRFPKDEKVADVCQGVPNVAAPKPDSIPAPPVKPPPPRAF